MASVPVISSSTSASLTVIITTSPTPSAPSTELLSAVFASFRKHCPQLLSCAVIVVFDTYERIASKDRLKKGQITVAGAANWAQYKENVMHLVLKAFNGSFNFRTSFAKAAEYGWEKRTSSVALTITQTHNSHVTFIEPAERIGFGLAVRSALRVVTTPYVWVHQHDWTLAADIRVDNLLDVMRLHTGIDDGVPVKYICLPSVRLLEYARSMHATEHPTLRALTAELKRDFTLPLSLPGSDSCVPLTPFFFWQDKPHIAETAHYLKRVFPTRLAIGRGEFIEDKVGQRARDQMKQGDWAKWATWLLYPRDGTELCLRHLQGRTFRGAEAEETARKMWIAKNAAARNGKSSETNDEDGSQ